MNAFCKVINTTFLVLFIFIIQACSSDDDAFQPVENLVLEDEQLLFERSLGEINTLLAFSPYEELKDFQDYLKYDVKYYTITYKTEYLGNDIIASGLVSFPETDVSVPILSFQNGTNTLDESAPTSNTQTFTFIGSIASAGYIFVVPDYIGFGSSDNQVSPYHQKDYTARAVIDLMKAAKELAIQEGFNFNGQAFLAGYSEGGYATMAAHRQMEIENPDGITLVASAPASGGYDVKGFQEYFFSQVSYSDPFYMAFVALSYKTVYGYGEPLSDLFQEPYASLIPDLFDGSKSGGQINSQLTTEIEDLLQPDILANIDTDPKYSEFVEALNDNNLTDWIPNASMYMFHGDQDITVPYQNSVDTYEKLLAAGASSDKVTLTTLTGHDHGSGFYPYLSEVVEIFEALK